MLSAVASLDGKLFCPVRNGEVVALSASDGSVLWRARVSGQAPVLAGCAVTKDRVYAVSNDGYLAALATIASAAPLLGLLGTVIGMIEIFGSQSPTGGATGGNPAQLAHGISVALYNTAFGLIVAIPALIFWRYFRARVDGYLLGLELAAERFVRHLNTLRK